MTIVEPNVILRGGNSPYLSAEQRIRYVAAPDSKLRLLRGNQYEHFEPTSESVIHEGKELRVFVWTGGTKVAE